jgi:hypothetical protein
VGGREPSPLGSGSLLSPPIGVLDSAGLERDCVDSYLESKRRIIEAM